MVTKNIQSIRGMHDCLPRDVFLWQKIENVFKIILNSYGYSEIRVPIVEFTDLFKHAMGEQTEIPINHPVTSREPRRGLLLRISQ